MKKIVITALIVLSISSVTKAYAFDDAALTPYTMDTMFDNFYESPLTMPVVETQDEPKVINNGPQASYYPLFKRARIKITNFFRLASLFFYIPNFRQKPDTALHVRKFRKFILSLHNPVIIGLSRCKEICYGSRYHGTVV